MATFKIHEDEENNYTRRPKKLINGEVQNAGEKKINENRRVLGHITNIQRNGEKIYNNKNTQNTKMNNIDKLNKDKKNVNTVDRLDKEYSNIPKLEKVNPLETPKEEHTTVKPEGHSKVISKVNEKDVKDHNKRLENYTKHLYRKEIYKYLLESERRHRPNSHYMDRQPELKDSMRSILIDWLVSISDEYTFTPGTLHLAVSYLDRFLSRMSVVRGKFQLVGVAAIMIAAKYEEIYPPDAGEFAYLTNDTYTVMQVLKMEQLMLRTLSFDLTTPTVHTFIEEYASQGNISKDIVSMAMYLGELCMVESVEYIKYLPSKIAASAIALASYTLHNAISTKELETICGYPSTELLPIINQLNIILNEVPYKSLQAVKIKYNRTLVGCVASIPPRPIQLNETSMYLAFAIVY